MPINVKLSENLVAQAKV